MKKGNAAKLSGPLAEPIYAARPDAATEDDEVWRSRISGRLLGKMDLLFEHYKIDPADSDCWLMLSFHLAIDFVPGMRLEPGLPPRKGRKRTWKAGLGDELLAAVDLTSKERCSNVRETIRYLARHDKKWKVYSPQSLEVRHREATSRRKKYRQRIAELMAGDPPRNLAEMAALYHSHTDKPGLYTVGALHPSKPSTTSDEK